MILAVAGAAVLVLILGITGGVLGVRALTDAPRRAAAPPAATDDGQAPGTQDPGTAPDPGAAQDPGSSAPSSQTAPSPQDPAALGGGATFGDITVSVVSTEAGIDSVGDGAAPMRPRGQFVAVALEFTNDSDRTLLLGERGQVQMQTFDGALHHPDADASAALDAPTSTGGEVPAGATGRIHVVFDVPADAEPEILHIDLAEYGGAGQLPVSG